MFSPETIGDVSKSQKTNIMGPIIALIGIEFLAFVPISIWCNDELIRHGLLITMLLSIFFGLFMYLYIYKKSPERLHNENHIYNMESLRLGSANLRDVTRDEAKDVIDVQNKITDSTTTGSIISNPDKIEKK